MSNRQEIPFKTLWAENAETTIPATPVIGDSYRDEATTDVTVGDGWAYGDPVPSQSENQYNYIQSLVARQLSEQGILSYSDKEDYSASVGAIVMDDGLPYLCLQDNGATSTVKQPSTEPLYWLQFGITQVENRLKPNQLPVVEGGTGHALPNAVPTAYPINSEPAAGYEFVTAATNVTFDAGLWKGTGQLQRKYKRDSAGFVSKTSEYAGVRLHDDTQLRALVDDIATNGCSITDDVDYVYVTFELSDFPNGVKFPFIAAEVGTIAEIGDDESEREQRGGFIRIDGVELIADVYQDGTCLITGSMTAGGQVGFANDLPITIKPFDKDLGDCCVPIHRGNDFGVNIVTTLLTDGQTDQVYLMSSFNSSVNASVIMKCRADI